MSEASVEQTAWDKIPLEKVAEGMHRRIVTGEKMTVARIYFEDGFRVPQHSHEHEQISQVIKGTLRFWFGADRDGPVDVGPGEVVVIPPHVPHEALSIGAVEEMDMWSPRRDDWLDGTDDYLRGGE
jgi:quercetin dioxygenase-like cupin family protein